MTLLCDHHRSVFRGLKQRGPHTPKADRDRMKRDVAAQCPQCLALARQETPK